MNKSDYDNFVEILNGVSDAVGTKRLPELGISVYWSCLQDFDLVDVRRAITAHLKDPSVGQFMPKPADIIRQLDGTSDDKALEAWSLVLPGIRGDYTARANKVKFADPVIHMVVSEMGGFTQMGSCKESELHWVQKEFMDRYNMRSRNPVESPEALPTSDYPSDQRADVLTIGRDVPRLQ